jgi:cytochrome c peroxidase
LLLVVLALVTAAAGQQPQPPAVRPPADRGQEPITPVPPPPAADPLKLALGERLFADLGLSRDGSRACMSCHDIRGNGADAKRFDKVLDGSELPFNTPTVFNPPPPTVASGEALSGLIRTRPVQPTRRRRIAYWQAKRVAQTARSALSV